MCKARVPVDHAAQFTIPRGLPTHQRCQQCEADHARAQRHPTRPLMAHRRQVTPSAGRACAAGDAYCALFTMICSDSSVRESSAGREDPRWANRHVVAGGPRRVHNRLGDTSQEFIPWGKTWYSQRIPGNPGREFMAVPGLRRIFGPPPPKRLSTLRVPPPPPYNR